MNQMLHARTDMTKGPDCEGKHQKSSGSEVETVFAFSHPSVVSHLLQRKIT